MSQSQKHIYHKGMDLSKICDTQKDIKYIEESSKIVKTH